MKATREARHPRGAKHVRVTNRQPQQRRPGGLHLVVTDQLRHGGRVERPGRDHAFRDFVDIASGQYPEVAEWGQFDFTSHFWYNLTRPSSPNRSQLRRRGCPERVVSRAPGSGPLPPLVPGVPDQPTRLTVSAESPLGLPAMVSWPRTPL